ncbi:MAG: hypothetical protein QM486_02395 [Flavobacteriaceae bacterium]
MNTKENQEDEIEIGKLFQLIGNGFTKLFKAIGDLLKFLFNALIFVLLFLRKHFIKFAIAAIIGFFGGYFSEGTERAYTSNMVVSANFNSIYQLYNNITNYNNLVMQKDTVGLSKLFNISNQEAANLKSFEIAPVITENEKLSLLDEFIKTADTTSVKLIDANVYLNSLTKFNFKNHKIIVKATKNDIFKKLESTIIDNLSKNNYFKSQKKTFDNNIAFEKRELTTQLAQIDSLRNLYKQVLLKEAEKKTPATQIDLSSKSNKKANELELFKIQKEINTRLEEINTVKVEEGEIINKVSGFSSVGTKVSIISRAPGLYTLYLVGLTLIIILLFELNKYLKNYQ